MTLRKVVLFVLCVFIPTLVFAGGNQQVQQTQSDAGPTEIIFYMWEDPTYIDIVNTFNESQDEVFVNAQILPNADYETRLTTLLAGGAKMDAFMQKRAVDMFGHYAAGHIEPLDNLIQQFGYDWDAISAYDAALTIDGSRVAIPFRGTTYYTFFNKALFDQHGEPYPSEYVRNNQWTWDTFAEVAQRVTGTDHYGAQVHTWAILQQIPAFQRQMNFIDANGNIDLDETALDFLQIRKNLEESGAMYPLLELLTSRTHYSTIFFENQASMLIIGEWFPGMLINAERQGNLNFDYEQWGVTRLPSDLPSSEYRSVGAPTFNHVHSRSQNKEAAFKFISWMGSSEGAEVVARAGFLPPLMTPGVEAILQDVLPDSDSFNSYIEKVEVFPPFYNKYGSRVNGLIERMTQEYLAGNLSDDEFMELFYEQLEEIVATTN